MSGSVYGAESLVKVPGNRMTSRPHKLSTILATEKFHSFRINSESVQAGGSNPSKFKKY
jgi:hypothetical protein